MGRKPQSRNPGKEAPVLRLSIKYLLIFCLIVLLLVFLVFIYSLYIGVLRISIEDAEAYHNDSLTKLAQAMDIRFGSLSRFAASLCYDRDTIALNQGPEDLWAYKSLLRYLQVYSTLNELDSAFTIYLGQKGKGFSSHRNVISIDDADMRQMYENNNQWYICDNPAARDSNPEPEPELIYTIFHDGEFPEEQVAVGISIQVSQLRRLLNLLSIRNKGLAFLTDGREIIYSKPHEITSVIDELGLPLKCNGSLYLWNRQVRVLYTPLNDYLSLGMVFPNDSLMEPVKKSNRLAIMLSILMAIVFSLIFILIYRWITHPLKTLAEGLGSVELGDYSVALGFHRIREVDYLYIQFDRMARRIENLLDEVHLENLRTKEAQLKFLQAQINPHFLYNNLNYIYQMSMSGDNTLSAEMSIALSTYYREVTKSSSLRNTLLKEIEMIEVYVTIFRLRLPDSLFLSTRIEQAIEQLEVPRLILQPFVENSIKYGLDTIDRALTIQIHGYIKEKMVHIIITDNGKGMRNSAIKELNVQLSLDHPTLKGAGLRNSIQRLQLHFNHSVSIHVQKNQPYGLSIEIIIPAVPVSGGQGG